MNYTIGLDFGTHQSKFCVEKREGRNQEFEFVAFWNGKDKYEYRLPSVIKLNEDDTLEYGFFDSDSKDRIFRYFKQATFNPKGSEWNETIDAPTVSVWYLTYIILYFYDRLGKFFNINIGIPTDSISFEEKEKIAVGLIVAAYHLAEDVYNKSMEAFLNATYQELLNRTNTKIEIDTKKMCKFYGIKVFPEAYACLRPLLLNNRLTTLNMMIDIGGGTTDISLFSVVKIRRNGKEDKILRIYYYTSVNLGLNNLYKEAVQMEKGYYTNDDALNGNDVNRYNKEIDRKLSSFMSEFESAFTWAAQGMFSLNDIDTAIRDKQTVYVGGGSVFDSLRNKREHFTDVRLMSTKDWKVNLIKKFKEMDSLCPILSTAYGLAISSDDDNIETDNNLNSLFDGIRQAAFYKKEELKQKRNSQQSSFGRDLGGFNYMDDWDAMK